MIDGMSAAQRMQYPELAPRFGVEDGRRAVDPSSSLLRSFPNRRVIDAWWTACQVPQDSEAVVPDGLHAWYCFRSVNPYDLFGVEVGVYGLRAMLLPCNADGKRGTEYVTGVNDFRSEPWGNPSGLGAAVVVGVDLGLPVDQWVGREARFPGFFDPPTNQGLPAPRSIMHRFAFPQGPITLDTNNRVAEGPSEYVVGFSPAIVPIRPGSTIDVALVVQGNQYRDAAGLAGSDNAFFSGGIDIQAFVAELVPTKGFSS